jgi:regulator of protease activity HflC (stomatin/prohibitin superfamily)
MEGAFGWIGELFAWFVSLLPHLDLCRVTHRGLKFKRGGKVRVIEPGLYWWWPCVTEVVTMPVVRQSVDIPAQTLTTKDGYSILISMTLVYEITDVEKALAQSYDVDDTITEFGGTAAVQVVTSRKFDEVREALSTVVPKELKRRCQKALYPFGVKVIMARLTDFAECTVIRNVGDGGVLPVVSSSGDDE